MRLWYIQLKCSFLNGIIRNNNFLWLSSMLFTFHFLRLLSIIIIDCSSIIVMKYNICWFRVVVYFIVRSFFLFLTFVIFCFVACLLMTIMIRLWLFPSLCMLMVVIVCCWWLICLLHWLIVFIVCCFFIFNFRYLFRWLFLYYHNNDLIRYRILVNKFLNQSFSSGCYCLLPICFFRWLVDCFYCSLLLVCYLFCCLFVHYHNNDSIRYISTYILYPRWPNEKNFIALISNFHLSFYCLHNSSISSSIQPLYLILLLILLAAR